MTPTSSTLFSKACFTLLYFLIFFSLAMAEEKSFDIEGVMSGLGETPHELSAIINGDIYSKADSVEGYVIEQISMENVTFTNQESGVAMTQAVGRKKTIESTESFHGKSNDQTDLMRATPQEVSWTEKLFKKVSPKLWEFQQKAVYSRLIADLKRIHVAAMQYVVMEGASEVDVSALVANGSLPPFFNKERKDGYVIRIHAAQFGVHIFADPKTEPTKKKHFMVDEHGYIYVKDGKRASQHDDVFSNEYSVTVPG